MKGLIFVFSMTYGGALVSLFRPWVGMLIYVSFAILKPDALWGFALPRLNYSRTIAIALLLGWCLNGFGNWDFGKAKIIVYSLLAFWAAALFGAAISPIPELSWILVEGLSKTFLPFLVGATLIRTEEQIKQLAWVIVLSQGWLAFEFNQLYYGPGLFIADDWKYGGLDNNGIAITLCACIGAAFFLGHYSKIWWQKLIAFAAAALMAHAILFSMSRGGMLAMGVTGFVTFMLIPKRPKDYFMAFLAACLVFRLAGPQVQEEFATAFVSEEERDASASSRILQWTAAVNVMASDPIGLGPGTWRYLCEPYGGRPGLQVHNNWLQVGAEYGVHALFFLLLFYVSGMLYLYALRFRVSADDPLRMWSDLVIASTVGFMASACFVSVEGVEPPYYVMLIAVGALRVAAERAKAVQNQPNYPLNGPAFGGGVTMAGGR